MAFPLRSGLLFTAIILINLSHLSADEAWTKLYKVTIYTEWNYNGDNSDECKADLDNLKKADFPELAAISDDNVSNDGGGGGGQVGIGTGGHRDDGCNFNSGKGGSGAGTISKPTCGGMDVRAMSYIGRSGTSPGRKGLKYTLFLNC